MNYPSPSALAVSGNYAESGSLPKKRKKISCAFSTEKEGFKIAPATFVASTIHSEGTFSPLATIGLKEQENVICIRGATLSTIMTLSFLKTLRLSEPIQVVLEPDGDGYIVRTTELPLYGFGETPSEATDNLKTEIETLYSDLSESDNFSEEWLTYKKYLSNIIIG